MRIPSKIVRAAMVVIAALLSGACYVTQDGNGQWWACEDYQSSNGTVTGCTPIEAPPFAR